MEFWNHRRESRRRTDQYALLLLISSTRLSQSIVLRRKFLTLNFVLLPRLSMDPCSPEPPPSLVIRNLHFVLSPPSHPPSFSSFSFSFSSSSTFSPSSSSSSSSLVVELFHYWRWYKISHVNKTIYRMGLAGNEN